MRREDMSREELTGDEPLAQALDRLGRLVAPESSPQTDMVARVMARIEPLAAEAPRPKRGGRWLAGSMAGLAAGLLLALALWRSMPGQHAVPAAATTENDPLAASSGPVDVTAVDVTAVDVAPVVRRSTWSTVTESVVLERDVPVRKLLYSEFERVELLDAQGNTASRLIVPTKAMLVATKERY